MNRKHLGRQSVRFDFPPSILSYASVVGKKEGEGPLAAYFDQISTDTHFGQPTWEKAESQMQTLALQEALKKASLSPSSVHMLFAGDLLHQCIGTSFAARGTDIPFYGLYGACSTMAESLSLAAMAVEGGYAELAAAMTSSHFASAERQYRLPLEYGGQRTPTAQWTVTGSGAVLVGPNQAPPYIRGFTTGKIVDYGLRDSMNMGACMAPAAADTIAQNLQDFGRTPEDYDQIITGDLGKVGKEILLTLMKEQGVDISRQHADCGIEIYDAETQDTHSGGSGCGCSAVTLGAYILDQLAEGRWKRVLFVPTGALLSTVSFNEGQTIPGIAHGVVLETA